MHVLLSALTCRLSEWGEMRGARVTFRDGCRLETTAVQYPKRALGSRPRPERRSEVKRRSSCLPLVGATENYIEPRAQFRARGALALRLGIACKSRGFSRRVTPESRHAGARLLGLLSVGVRLESPPLTVIETSLGCRRLNLDNA